MDTSSSTSTSTSAQTKNLQKEIELKLSTVKNEEDNKVFEMLLWEKELNTDKSVLGICKRIYFQCFFYARVIQFWILIATPMIIQALSVHYCFRDITYKTWEDEVQSNFTIFSNVTYYKQTAEQIFLCSTQGLVVGMIVVSIMFVTSYLFMSKARIVEPLTNKHMINEYSPWTSAFFFLSLAVFALASWGLININIQLRKGGN